MKTKRLFFLLAILSVLNACSNNVENKEAAMLQNEQRFVDFTQIDSIQFFYYPQPQNQKEFKTFLIKDTFFVKEVIGNLSMPTVDKKACTHNVKMYLYRKGDVYKTVYAALDDSCQYLAYIVNGKPYFVSLNMGLENGLRQRIKNIEAG